MATRSRYDWAHRVLCSVWLGGHHKPAQIRYVGLVTVSRFRSGYAGALRPSFEVSGGFPLRRREESLPLTSVGKIDKKKLRVAY
ncbi:MAG: hypothetical protein ACLP4V_08655 [Methylocella sp.]